MAWNEDNWRLAAEAFNTALESVQAAQRAVDTLGREDPATARRLELGGGQAGRDAQIAASRLQAFARLPDTEPEARRAIQAAQQWKSRFNSLDGMLAAAGNAGRVMTRDDRAAINRAGFEQARELLVMVPWSRVTQLMSIRQAAPRTPAAPRRPADIPYTRRRRGRGGMGPWLPILIIGVLMFSKK